MFIIVNFIITEYAKTPYYFMSLDILVDNSYLRKNSFKAYYWGLQVYFNHYYTYLLDNLVYIPINYT